jgi:hypothetical protein
LERSLINIFSSTAARSNGKPKSKETEPVRDMSEELTLQPNRPLAEFFEKALAREPENRFVSASAMKDNLTRAIADLQN